MKFMGIDVGTTGVKATVFDENGVILGYGFQNYPIIFGGSKYAEQDAEFVWARTKDAMLSAIASSGPDIASISLSTQGDAVIPVDRNRNALHHAILGMDYRTEPEASQCAALLDDQHLFCLTGMRPHPMNSLTKMMWLQKNCPQLEANLWKYTTYADFILLKLGSDTPVIDLTMASRVMALELRTRRWSSEILDAVGIPAGLLSEPAPSGEIVGTIRRDLAEDLGINPRAKIVTGGHDQPCAALGAGVTGEGIALDSHGTAEVLSTAFESVRLGDSMYEGYYPCTYHVVPDRYFTFALNHTGGLLLQWLRDTCCTQDIEDARKLNMDPYTYLIGRAPDKPSSVMVLPHFNGSGTPWCDLKSKGAFLGLTMDTTREDLVKAMLDSLTYEMRINLERLNEAQVSVRRLRCVGGAAKSEKWMQIKADILGCTVETLAVREAACLGAAMLAATAVGTYGSPMEALAMVQLQKRFEPNPASHQLYDSKYRTYCKIYQTLKPLNHLL